MKKILIAFLLVVVWIAYGIYAKFIGFRYPEIIENQPYQSPSKVVSLSGNILKLENGETLVILDHDRIRLDELLLYSGNIVEPIRKKNSSEIIGLLSLREGWVCGTPWCQPIKIPLFKDTAYKNRLEPIAVVKDLRFRK